MTAGRRQKIKLRKYHESWYVIIPGPIPEMCRFAHWSDAVALVFLVVAGAYE